MIVRMMIAIFNSHVYILYSINCLRMRYNFHYGLMLFSYLFTKGLLTGFLNKLYSSGLMTYVYIELFDTCLVYYIKIFCLNRNSAQLHTNKIIALKVSSI